MGSLAAVAGPGGAVTACDTSARLGGTGCGSAVERSREDGSSRRNFESSFLIWDSSRAISSLSARARSDTGSRVFLNHPMREESALQQQQQQGGCDQQTRDGKRPG